MFHSFVSAGDDYPSFLGSSAPADASATHPRRRDPEPSKGEWELLKGPLIDQRVNQKKTGKELVEWVKSQGYHTT